MPWQEVSLMSSRKEFVSLARQEGVNFSALCRRFDISPKTGYKLVKRFEAEGEAGLLDRPRRPKSSPRRTPSAVEELLLATRDEHPAWGARKLLRWLADRGLPSCPPPVRRPRACAATGDSIPSRAPSTRLGPVSNLPRRMISGRWTLKAMWPCGWGAVIRSPYWTTIRASPCACPDERAGTVRDALTDAFRCYGLPWRMTMDNGPPWGGDPDSPHTALTVWLLRLGIRVGHSRPYHPQTQGKDERFHRTLKAEVLKRTTFADQAEAQQRLDAWRDRYNLERPHQALGMAAPVRRYQPSPRSFPEVLPPIEYGPDDAVRKVQGQGEIHYRGREWRIGKAFHGQPVALRATAKDGVWEVFFCHQRIASIDLHDAQCTS